MTDELAAPKMVDRSTFQAELDALRVREKAHTREGDAIAAARRRLPMVEVDGATPLIGEHGTVTLLDAFEGRRMLIAYYFMWNTGHPAPEQCEGCTWVTSQVRELSYIHSRDVTFALCCQGPYEESARYRDFMGWEMPWYSAQDSLDTLLVGRRVGRMHIVCYLRQRSKVFETYWTTIRGVEVMDNSFRLLDLTVYGRQETWEGYPMSCANLAVEIELRPLPLHWEVALCSREVVYKFLRKRLYDCIGPRSFTAGPNGYSANVLLILTTENKILDSLAKLRYFLQIDYRRVQS